MSDSKKRCYLAAIRVLVDGASGAAAFAELQRTLAESDVVLDFHIDRVESAAQLQDARITAGEYRDGEAFTDDGFVVPAAERRAPSPGDQVVWNDPDAGLSTGVYRVIERVGPPEPESPDDAMFVLAGENGSCVEALACELTV